MDQEERQLGSPQAQQPPLLVAQQAADDASPPQSAGRKGRDKYEYDRRYLLFASNYDFVSRAEHRGWFGLFIDAHKFNVQVLAYKSLYIPPLRPPCLPYRHGASISATLCCCCASTLPPETGSAWQEWWQH